MLWYVLGLLLLVLVFFIWINRDKNLYHRCFEDKELLELTLKLSSKFNFLDRGYYKNSFIDKLSDSRKEISKISGLILPLVKVEFIEELECNEYEIYLLKNLIARGSFYPGKMFVVKETFSKLFTEVPENTITYVNYKHEEYYVIDSKVIKNLLKVKSLKLKNLEHLDFFDILLKELEIVCYEYIEDIIDLKYIARYLDQTYSIAGLGIFGLTYKDKRGLPRYLSANELRQIKIDLFKNNYQIGSKTVFIQKLTDCLSNYEEIYSTNLRYLIEDMKDSLNKPEPAKV